MIRKAKTSSVLKVRVAVERKLYYGYRFISEFSGKSMDYGDVKAFRHQFYKKGSITSIQAVYVPADDYTDPAPATTFAHLDSVTALSRAISELGIYPAVDPLESSSRILDPQIVGEEHYNTARKVQEILQRYKELQDIIEANKII